MLKNRKTDLGKDLFRFVHHNVLSLFKICCEYLVAFIISSIMFYLSRTVDYLKILTDEEVKNFVLN